MTHTKERIIQLLKNIQEQEELLKTYEPQYAELDDVNKAMFIASLADTAITKAKLTALKGELE